MILNKISASKIRTIRWGGNKIQSVPFTLAVMPDEKLKFPEIGLKDEGYYYNVIDKLAGKGGFFSKLFG